MVTSLTKHVVPALAVSALILLLGACGGDGPTSPANDGVQSTTAASVTVEPGEATLTAIDATQSFSATVTDSEGSAVSGAEVTWTTTDSTVASVDGSGTATARASGAVDVIARIEGVADTARLVVEPQVDDVVVSPAEDSVAGNGGTVRLSAEPVDRNGNILSTGLVVWSSSDTTVAFVNQAGVVTGRRLGQVDVEVRARSVDVADTARITVFDPPGNDPPLASVRAPGDLSEHSIRDTIAFSGSANDLEEGSLAGASLEWRSSQDGEIGTGEEFSTSTLSSGDHRISLVATDSEGLADTASIDIAVRTGVNLVIDRLQITRGGILESETQAIGAVIRNTEFLDAGAFNWVLKVGVTEAASGRIDGVPAGDTAVVPLQTGLGPYIPGPQTVELDIDIANEVEESREGDNEALGRFRSYSQGFDIELEFLSVADSSKLEVFRQAEERWEGVVTGDLPDVQISGVDAGFCADGAGTLDRTVNDLLIFVRVDSIDGPQGVLGRAGPCFVRETSSGDVTTPVVGGMVFDVADLDFLEGEGLLQTTILHEMGHVLGIGTLWPPHGLLEGGGTADPVYTGTAGRAGFRDVGGESYAGTPVPVENMGGEGTRDGHWRESIFDNELMTGAINTGSNPMSLVTVASLRDQLLPVDESQADAYQLPSGSALRFGDGVDLGDDLLRAPLIGISPDGRVRGIDRRRFRDPR